MRMAIIGASIAGLSCAESLRRGGHEVTVFEKNRGIGGRIATRRTPEDLRFDHGAQFLRSKVALFVSSWLVTSKNGMRFVIVHFVGARNGRRTGTRCAIAQSAVDGLRISHDKIYSYYRRDRRHWPLDRSKTHSPWTYCITAWSKP